MTPKVEKKTTVAGTPKKQWRVQHVGLFLPLKIFNFVHISNAKFYIQNALLFRFSKHS